MNEPSLAERMAVRPVAPDVWAVPVPIPDNPLRYTVCYALEAAGGLVLLDPGWDADATYEALVSGLATLGGAVGDVRGVIVTHFHPDHHGLAGRVRAESGAWIALHDADARFFGSDAAAVEAMVRTNEVWMRAAGASVDDHPELADAEDEVVRRILLARPDIHPLDGDRLPGTGRLTVVHTPGHTPGHICLHDPDRRLLFGGDHLLPRISPNVGWHPMSGTNPLSDFLASLQRVAQLDAATDLVLPAHEWAFTGPAARAMELIRHHDERLAEVKGLLVAGPQTAWDLVQGLTWSRPWASLAPNLKRAALGEVLAHLVLLLSAGEVTRSMGPPEVWSMIQEEPA
ncbi:MBL fold metallo-hydrolase [Actinomadura sp. KC345]|uniref:MBL fold metallo-hydrolase n=1 Tax=Actinomadura sp. KC345 TaxID=2530371 RepID=UPI0010497C00|nr:MBL fold metallo-hydrolase [Actinomadura sp. KC345]TDC58566.1 MBL fold metallo-hydrolase [Actinomadura sp. KC345]